MTLTVTGFITSGPVGPGYALVVHTDLVGPIPNTDVASVQINKAGTGQTLDGGAEVSHGSHSVGVVIGYGPVNSGGFKGTPLATGDPVDLLLTWMHGDFSIVEQDTVTGFTWDPVGGLYGVVERAMNVVLGDKLDQVLAAVIRTFPAP